MLHIITTSLLSNILHIHIYVHNLDYAYKYTTLSEWYDTQYSQWCFIH